MVMVKPFPISFRNCLRPKPLKKPRDVGFADTCLKSHERGYPTQAGYGSKILEDVKADELQNVGGTVLSHRTSCPAANGGQVNMVIKKVASVQMITENHDHRIVNPIHFSESPPLSFAFSDF
jgi:hypothetical protein